MFRRRFIVLSILFTVFLFGAQIGKRFFAQIVCNTGIGFGIGGGVWLIVLGIVFVSALGFFVVRELQKERTIRFAYLVPVGGGFLLGGAISNLLDRLVYGCVADYFQPFLWFPAFNIADIGVSMGVGLLVVYLFRENSYQNASNN